MSKSMPDELDLPAATALARAIAANRAAAAGLAAAGWPADLAAGRAASLAADLGEQLLENEAAPLTIAAARLAA